LKHQDLACAIRAHRQTLINDQFELGFLLMSFTFSLKFQGVGANPSTNSCLRNIRRFQRGNNPGTIRVSFYNSTRFSVPTSPCKSLNCTSRCSVTAVARIQRIAELCFRLFARASGATLEARFALKCRLLPPRPIAKSFEGNKISGAGDGNRTHT